MLITDFQFRGGRWLFSWETSAWISETPELNAGKIIRVNEVWKEKQFSVCALTSLSEDGSCDTRQRHTGTWRELETLEQIHESVGRGRNRVLFWSCVSSIAKHLQVFPLPHVEPLCWLDAVWSLSGERTSTTRQFKELCVKHERLHDKLSKQDKTIQKQLRER